MKKMLLRLAAFLATLGATTVAFAQEAANVYTATASSTSNWVYAVCAALAIAIAASAGAMSQARAAATALDAIGRNPGAAGKIQTPMIIALALIESLIIYALVIAFLLQAKIPALPS